MASSPIPESGVWCPAITFFNRGTDSINWPAQKKYFKYLSTTGLAGLVILGTNAEAFLLTREERYQLIAAAREAVGPSYPIMAGIGSHSTKQSIEFLEDATKAGASFTLCLPPAYFGKATTNAAISSFFDDVAKASKIPMVLYNFPGVCNGVDLSSDQIAAIARKNPNVVGVKLTCGSVGKITRLSGTFSPSEFAIFGGQSDFLIGGLAAGSSGCIAAFANVCPKTVVQVYKLYKAGNFEEALKLHQKAALAESCIKSGSAATKYAVSLISAPAAGIEGAESLLLPRKPYEGPSADVKAGVEKAISEISKIESAL